MNNEEKIISMLERFAADVNGRLSNLEAGQNSLVAGQQKISKDVNAINVALTSFVFKDIKRLEQRVDHLEQICKAT